MEDPGRSPKPRLGMRRRSLIRPNDADFRDGWRLGSGFYVQTAFGGGDGGERVYFPFAASATRGGLLPLLAVPVLDLVL